MIEVTSPRIQVEQSEHMDMTPIRLDLLSPPSPADAPLFLAYMRDEAAGAAGTSGTMPIRPRNSRSPHHDSSPYSLPPALPPAHPSKSMSDPELKTYCGVVAVLKGRTLIRFHVAIVKKPDVKDDVYAIAWQVIGDYEGPMPYNTSKCLDVQADQR